MVQVDPRDVPTPADYNLNGGGVSPTDSAEAAASAPTAAYKRTGASRPELLKRYRQRIGVSKRWRKDEGYDETWERLIDIYRNRFFTEQDSDDSIAVNISFSTVNTIGPGVAVNYPSISVNPRREEFEGAATAVEAAVNYWWKHYDWRKETKKCVKDSLVIGHGWAKVWWKYATTPRPTTAAEQQQHYADASQQAGDLAEQNPAQAHLIPTNDEIWAQVPTTTTDVVVDQPCVERVSPPDILIDPEATSDTDLSWIAQRIVRPLSEVKADVSYNAAARAKVQADAGTNPRWRDDGDAPTSAGGTRSYSDDVKRVTLWEFYDLRNGFYCVFAENGGPQFLLDPTDLPYSYGHPFVYLGNYDVPDHFYDIGDLEVLEPLQQELNAVRTDMRNHRKRYQRKYMALRDKFDASAEAALESDRDGAVVWIDGDEDLSRIVAPVPQQSLDPQMYQYSEQIENDVDLVSGVSEYQRGAQSEIRRTATEASMIADASNARAADKLALVEVFLQEIARRVVALAQQYLTGDHAVQILGQDGAQQWLPFDNATIQGEFDFEVEAGSTQPQDENFKRQQAMQLVQALQPYVGTTVDPTQLVLYVLRDGFGVKNPEQFIMQQSPQQQGPSDKIIESIAYKDAPPDIKAQMEQQAGMTPSAAWAGAMQAGQAQQGAQGAPEGSPGEEAAESPQQEQAEQAQGAGDASQQLPSGATANAGPNIDPRVLLAMQQQGGANPAQ